MVKFTKSSTPTSLIDYRHVQPMPRSTPPSRINAWCEEHCQQGWLIQYPLMGQPTFKNTVILFQDFADLTAFRDHYCFDAKYHKRTHETDFLDGGE